MWGPGRQRPSAGLPRNITNTGREKICRNTVWNSTGRPEGELPGDTLSILPINYSLQPENVANGRDGRRVWVSADGRGSVSQDMPAVLITQRWISARMSHGNRTKVPPQKNKILSYPPPGISKTLTGCTPCLTRCVKPWDFLFQRGFGFFPGLFRL